MENQVRASSSLSTLPITLIQPTKGWVSLKLCELWRSRELLFFLTWRDIKVRYKQTALGAAWALLQPLFAMLVFTLFFGRLAKIPSDRIPYPLFCLSALIMWNLFANGITQSSNSLVESANLLTKVSFPRLTLPISAVVAGFVDFAVSFVLLAGVMAFYHRMPPAQCVYLPFFVLLAFLNAVGAGLWLSALNVEYRDVRYLLPFLIQFWLFATPIVYPSSLLSDRWRAVYGLNPMAGAIEGFRWALFGANRFPGAMVLVSTITAMCVLVGGAFFFRRMERTFADLV